MPDTPLERPVQSHHVLRVRNARNRPELYVVLDLPGLYPRRYGPFRTHAAICAFLEEAYRGVGRALRELENALELWQRVVIEDGVQAQPRRGQRPAPVVTFPHIVGERKGG